MGLQMVDFIIALLGFAVVVLCLLALMWGYGRFVKGPSIDQRLGTLEELAEQLSEGESP